MLDGEWCIEKCPYFDGRDLSQMPCSPEYSGKEKCPQEADHAAQD